MKPFTDDFLATLPRRDIWNETGIYLVRWTLAERVDGSRVYVHHFQQSDATHELHSHPWVGESLILAGGYFEDRLVRGHRVVRRRYDAGDRVFLHTDTFHRVDLVDAEAGCWTLFEAGARQCSWSFLDLVTWKSTPWRDALRARGIDPGPNPANR